MALQFEAPADLVAWDCNCSVCAMRRNGRLPSDNATFADHDSVLCMLIEKAFIKLYLPGHITVKFEVQ